MADKKDPPYFMYFPGNYRWSAAFINMLGSAPYGGSEIGELHKIGTLLKGTINFQPDPSWLQVIAWVGYLVPVLWLYLRKPKPAATKSEPASVTTS